MKIKDLYFNGSVVRSSESEVRSDPSSKSVTSKFRIAGPQSAVAAVDVVTSHPPAPVTHSAHGPRTRESRSPEVEEWAQVFI